MWGGEGRSTVNRIISYYSYLFSFPSHKVLLIEEILVTLVGGSLAFLLSEGITLFTLFHALAVFTLPSLLSDLLVSRLVKKERLFTSRRCTALSFSVSILWVSTFALFSAIAMLVGVYTLIPRAFMMGFVLSLVLRWLVFFALTSGGVKVILAAASQPVFCLVVAVVLLLVDRSSLLLGLAVSLSLILGVWVVIEIVNRGRYGGRPIETLPLLQAFMLAWSEGISEPLEHHLEKIGEETDLPVKYIAFHSGGRRRCLLVVSYIHSGPFRNVGSSALPLLIREALEKKLGYETLFFHGISTHDRDLVSQSQNQKVIQKLLDGVDVGAKGELASPVVREIKDGAAATCQLFSDQALITLTVSPKSFDDLPKSLEERIAERGRALGLETLVVDLHNCIDESDMLEDKDVSNLYEAACEAMKHAVDTQKAPPHVGFSRVVPPEFSLRDGMGPTGVEALVVEVDGQRSVYVILDGNNMISGLREVLTAAVKELGAKEVEVATTDTHIVNGLSMSPRGYYPIGEKIDWNKLADYVKKAVTQALGSLEPASFSYGSVEIKGLRVIGEGGLNSLGEVLEGGFRRFKSAVSIILLPAVFLSLFLLLL